MTPLAKLKLKQASLTSWLGDKLQVLRALRKNRDAQLSISVEAIKTAEAACSEIEGILELARAMREVASELSQRASLDLQAAGQAVEEASRCHLGWRERFKLEQDGRTRRKRGELAKVSRRIVEKEALQARRAARETPLSAEDISYGKGLDLTYGTSK